MRRNILTFFGSSLLALGLLGPFTFADDLRHFGEVAVTISLALIGCLLLAPQLLQRWRCSSSVPLASPFVLLGLAVGTFMDKAMLGMLLGACSGAAVVWWHCSRHRRGAA